METVREISLLALAIECQLIDEWPDCMMEVEFDSLFIVKDGKRFQIVWEAHSSYYALYRNNSKHENLISKKKTRPGIVQSLGEVFKA